MESLSGHIGSILDENNCFSEFVAEFVCEDIHTISFNIDYVEDIEVVKSLFPEYFVIFAVVKTAQEDPDNNSVLAIFSKKH